MEKTHYSRPAFKKFPFSRIFEHYHGYKRWKHLFKVSNNPILFFLVNLCLYFDWGNNRGAFSIGDYVVFNWKAKVVLGSLFLNDKHGALIHRIGGYEVWSSTKSNVFFMNDREDGCSVFWLRLATKNEISKYHNSYSEPLNKQ